eukprot:scaffold303_cov49-Cyclotella_meneghiniana.AAC.4
MLLKDTCSGFATTQNLPDTRYPGKMPVGTGIWLAGCLPDLIIEWSGIPDYLSNLSCTEQTIPEYR